jgi:transposase
MNVSTKVRWFVGLDVHAETIAVAVAEANGGEVRSLGIIPNREQSVKKLLVKLGAKDTWKACYEAGPTGYALYWQLTKFGCTCVVVAPTLIPVKPGDRIKTDRRDAERLARAYRAGDLTSVWVPDAEHEALRDLVRAREAAKQDQLRARNRLSKYLLRHGIRPAVKMKAWTQRYLEWVRRDVKFEQDAQQAALEDYLDEIHHQAQRISRFEKLIDEAVEKAPESMQAVIGALQALRGVAKISAVTIVSEVGQLSRFPTARQAMAYSGLIPSEHTSGEKVRRGGITKTGNTHLRRVLVEAAWSARFQPTLTPRLRSRQEGLSAVVIEIAGTARHRLHSRYVRLLGRSKNKQQVITAVARDLIGFVWAIGKAVESDYHDTAA